MKIGVFVGVDTNHPITDLLKKFSKYVEIVAFAKENIRDIPTHIVNFSSYPFLGEELDLSLLNYPSVENVVKEEKIDAVLLFGLERLSLLGLTLAKKLSIPVAAHLIKKPFVEDEPSVSKYIEKAVVGFSLQHVDGVIFPTKKLHEEVKKSVKIKHSLVAYPPIEEKEKNEEVQRKDIAVGGHSIEPVKKIEEVIEVFPSILNKYKSLKLHVFGEGKHKKHLENLKEKLMLGNSVVFRGLIPREEFIESLRSFRMYVYPSKDEGFSLTPIEALSVGTPVVYKKSSFLSEVLSESLGYEEKGDILSLYEEIRGKSKEYSDIALEGFQKWKEKSEGYFESIIKFISSLSSH